SYLDTLLKTVLSEDCSDEERRLETYGHALNANTTPALRVYATGSVFHAGSSSAAAGSAIFDGSTSVRQRCFRVPGVQTDNRAKLHSILVALTLTPSGVPLTVLTPSEYAIRSIVSWGPKNATAGWRCDHGDILTAIQKRLLGRSAAVHFIFLGGRTIHGDANQLDAV
ncbi:hypothetical protein BDZ89DRAFT_908813, partial [Hymenopellis radicata]